MNIMVKSSNRVCQLVETQEEWNKKQYFGFKTTFLAQQLNLKLSL